MPKEDDATQTGASQEGAQDTQQQPPKQGHELRAALLDQVFESRLDNFEEESGLKIERDKPAVDPDVDPDDATAEAERARLEAEAADKKDEPKDEPKLDVASQLKAHADGSELILDAATLSKSKVRIKVDGEETLVDAAKVLAQYQKGAAADIRLAEATKLRNEAQAKFDEALKGAAAVEPGDKPAPKSSKKGLDKFKKASEALFEGDVDRASALFAEATTEVSGGDPAPKGQEGPNAEAIVQAVEQRLSQRSALAQLFQDYPEIKQDEDLALLTDRYVSIYQAQGDSVGEAISKAGELVGEKFKLGKHGRPKENAQPTTTGTTSREVKLEHKKTISEQPTGSGASSATNEPRELTASELIAEIKASRRQSL